MPRRPAEGAAWLLGCWLAVAGLLPLVAPPAFSDEARAQAAETALRALEDELSSAVNEHRARQRLIDLRREPALDAVARAHSRDMATRSYLSHQSPEGDDWVARLRRAGIDGFSMAGENVGMTSRPRPNEEILRGWVLSAVHRQNLEARPYNATGVGIARAPDGSLYYTQLYLTFPVE